MAARIDNFLQTKLTKRFSNGVTFLTSYTFGKALSDGEGNEYGGAGSSGQWPQDDNNRRSNYARAIDDARHRFVLSYIWQLPVGNGGRWMDRSGVASGILGGWELSGIWTIQSGFPFAPASTQDFSNTGSVTPRPDRTCTGVGHKTVSSWFDASCFTTAGLSQALTAGQSRFGNTGRNILDAPSLDSVDFALMKNFQLAERLKSSSGRRLITCSTRATLVSRSWGSAIRISGRLPALATGGMSSFGCETDPPPRSTKSLTTGRLTFTIRNTSSAI